MTKILEIQQDINDWSEFFNTPRLTVQPSISLKNLDVVDENGHVVHTLFNIKED